MSGSRQVVSETKEMSVEFVRAVQMDMDDPGLPFPTDQELFEAEQCTVQESYRLGIIANTMRVTASTLFEFQHMPTRQQMEWEGQECGVCPRVVCVQSAMLQLLLAEALLKS